MRDNTGGNAMERSDEQLMTAARGGEVSAFEELTARHREAVWRVAYRLLGNEEEAFDACQDVFVKAWRLLPTERFSDTHFRGWLFRLTVNLCRDRLRARRRRLQLFVPLSDDASDSTSPDPLKVWETRVWSEEVRRAVESLPEAQRVVVILRHYEGLTTKEIAETLNLSHVTVRVRLTRVMAALRKKLTVANTSEENVPDVGTSLCQS